MGTAAVLLSVCASARRHGLNAWSYLRDLFDRLPAWPAGADLHDFLPDVWAATHLGGAAALPVLGRPFPIKGFAGRLR